MPNFKQCTKCKVSKPLSEFHKDNSTKSGCYPQCKMCKSEWGKEYKKTSKGQKHQKQYRQEHRKELREYQQKYRKDGKAGIGNRKYYGSQKGQNSILKYYYSITYKDYTEILLKQNGVCAICGRTETSLNNKGGLRPLSIDHDHIIGKIRGLLCVKCNIMLGNANDNPDILKKGTKYLEEHK